MKTISNPTYVLRTCNKNLQGHNGFQWPEKGYVEALDWDPKSICVGGFHGLLMGKGSANLLDWDDEAIWQVIEVQEDKIVWIDDDQVKFPYGNVVYSGNRKDATDLIISLGADPKDVPGSYQIGGDFSTLTGGKFSTLYSGEYSTVQGGERSTLTGGYGSTLTGSEGSTLTGGPRSIVQGGDYSTLRGGYGSTLTGGRGSTVQGGDRSIVQGGRWSTLTGGDGSTLTGGDYSTLRGGDGSTLTGGNDSTLQGGEWSKFKAGEESCFIGSYWKDGRKRLIKVCVGEDGIKANTWYLFEKNAFTEVVDN